MIKLWGIQDELKVPKNNYNSFGEYKFRSCEDILESVKPLLKVYKCILTLSDNIIMLGTRYYVQSTVKLTDIESGNSIECSGIAREPENKKKFDESQLSGMASSYARKYALNGLFCIDDTKDADNFDDSEKVNKQEKTAINENKPLISASNQARKKELLVRAGVLYSKLNETQKAHYVEIKNSKTFNDEDYKMELTYLETLEKEIGGQNV